MKQHANSLDVRIQRFMDKKISEFPELNSGSSQQVTLAQQGSVWTDIVGVLKGEKAA